MVCGIRLGPHGHKGPNSSHLAVTEHVEVGSEDYVFGCSGFRGTLHSGTNQERGAVGTRSGQPAQVDSNYGAPPIVRPASIISDYLGGMKAAHAP